MNQNNSDVHWQWLQACYDVLSEIDNEWEQGFIESLYFKMKDNNRYYLSPRQVEILERIYAKWTK